MTTFSLVLPSADVFQILDAVDSRAESWEYTAGHLAGNLDQDDEFRAPEECDSADEAAGIAKHFRDIGATIRKQIKTQ
ncbi:MAG: hypothetical protein V1809_16295 [Planctomycetota bacterium]